jgi:dihydrofolate reductase
VGAQAHRSAGDPAGRGRKTLGAVFAGRRWYELATEHWDGVDGIYHGAFEGEVFVLTHHPPGDDTHPRITFTSDPIEDLVAAAQTAAGGEDVAIFGGSLSRQCLQAGLLDEIVRHAVLKQPTA